MGKVAMTALTNWDALRRDARFVKPDERFLKLEHDDQRNAR